MAYKTAKLNLTSQGIAGSRHWIYSDTGDSPATIVASGFFTDAYDKGVRAGDTLTWQELTTPDAYQAHFSAVSDTGVTQGTIVLDTD
jgi:hypothetical protein